MNRTSVGGTTRRSHFRITLFSITGSMVGCSSRGDAASCEAESLLFSSERGHGTGSASVILCCDRRGWERDLDYKDYVR